MFKKCTQISKIFNSAVTGANFPLVLKTHMKTGDNTELHIRAKMINFSLVAYVDKNYVKFTMLVIEY